MLKHWIKRIDIGLDSLLRNFKEYKHQWYVKSGLEARDLQSWRDENFRYAASNVQDYFCGFKYVFQVDYKKVYEQRVLQTWQPVFEIDALLYPHKPLDESAAMSWLRGYYNSFTGEFVLSEMGGVDLTFFATNNKDDAIMVALKYK